MTTEHFARVKESDYALRDRDQMREMWNRWWYDEIWEPWIKGITFAFGRWAEVRMPTPTRFEGAMPMSARLKT